MVESSDSDDSDAEQVDDVERVAVRDDLDNAGRPVHPVVTDECSRVFVSATGNQVLPTRDNQVARTSPSGELAVAGVSDHNHLEPGTETFECIICCGDLPLDELLSCPTLQCTNFFCRACTLSHLYHPSIRYKFGQLGIKTKWVCCSTPCTRSDLARVLQSLRPPIYPGPDSTTIPTEEDFINFHNFLLNPRSVRRTPNTVAAPPELIIDLSQSETTVARPNESVERHHRQVDNRESNDSVLGVTTRHAIRDELAAADRLNATERPSHENPSVEDEFSSGISDAFYRSALSQPRGSPASSVNNSHNDEQGETESVDNDVGQGLEVDDHHDFNNVHEHNIETTVNETAVNETAVNETAVNEIDTHDAAEGEESTRDSDNEEENTRDSDNEEGHSNDPSDNEAESGTDEQELENECEPDSTDEQTNNTEVTIRRTSRKKQAPKRYTQ